MTILWGESNNPELREALSHITETYESDEQIGQHIALIEGLRTKYDHSITLITETIPNRKDMLPFNCYQYAFNLMRPPSRVIAIWRNHQDVYANSEFAQFLINETLIERMTRQFSNRDIVIYSDQGLIKHAGIMKKGLVLSKWGNGHLWRHRIYEAPKSYGDDIRFFEPLSRQRSVDAFLRYANNKLTTTK